MTYCKTNKRFDELLQEMGRLHDAKNKGYAVADDPLHNFRACEEFGVPMYQGIAVRISDKQSRWLNLVKDADNDQVGESLEDTTMDEAVYLLLFLIALEEYKRVTPLGGRVAPGQMGLDDTGNTALNRLEELCSHDGVTDASACPEADGFVTPEEYLDQTVTVGWTPNQYEMMRKASHNPLGGDTFYGAARRNNPVGREPTG